MDGSPEECRRASIDMSRLPGLSFLQHELSQSSLWRGLPQQHCWLRPAQFAHPLKSSCWMKGSYIPGVPDKGFLASGEARSFCTDITECIWFGQSIRRIEGASLGAALILNLIRMEAYISERGEVISIGSQCFLQIIYPIGAGSISTCGFQLLMRRLHLKYAP